MAVAGCDVKKFERQTKCIGYASRQRFIGFGISAAVIVISFNLSSIRMPMSYLYFHYIIIVTTRYIVR